MSQIKKNKLHTLNPPDTISFCPFVFRIPFLFLVDDITGTNTEAGSWLIDVNGHGTHTSGST
jgi:hypothetical protein